MVSFFHILVTELGIPLEAYLEKERAWIMDEITVQIY